MTERSSSHPRDAFAVLVAALPRPPAELMSPDTPDAEELFRHIVADPRTPGSRSIRRRQFSLAVCAAAAAAVVGALLTVPGRGGPTSVGSADPVPTEAAGPEPESPAIPWPPSLPPSPPVGDLDTFRATMLDGVVLEGRTDFAIDGPDVSIVMYSTRDVMPGPDEAPPTLGLEVATESRYVDGQWYNRFANGNLAGRWLFDPDDGAPPIGISATMPRNLLDLLAPAAGFESEGHDLVRGVETVRLIAATPELVDPALVRFYNAMPPVSVESLELWVDSNGIVHRIAVTGVVENEQPSTTRVSVEFYDIGESITVDVPRDAAEVDSQG